MAKIVIDITDEEYEDYKTLTDYGYGTMFNSLVERIANGVVLPKGHGRLIDADALRCENADFDTYNDYCTMFDEIDYAPTIPHRELGISGATGPGTDDPL